MGVGRQIKFAAADAGFELRGAIAAVAETVQDSIEVRQEIYVDAAIRWNVLAQAEITRLTAKLAFLEQLQRVQVAPVDVGPGRKIVHRMNY